MCMGDGRRQYTTPRQQRRSSREKDIHEKQKGASQAQANSTSSLLVISFYFCFPVCVSIILLFFSPLCFLATLTIHVCPSPPMCRCIHNSPPPVGYHSKKTPKPANDGPMRRTKKTRPTQHAALTEYDPLGMNKFGRRKVSSWSCDHENTWPAAYLHWYVWPSAPLYASWQPGATISTS